MEFIPIPYTSDSESEACDPRTPHVRALVFLTSRLSQLPTLRSDSTNALLPQTTRVSQQEHSSRGNRQLITAGGTRSVTNVNISGSSTSDDVEAIWAVRQVHQALSTTNLCLTNPFPRLSVILNCLFQSCMLRREQFAGPRLHLQHRSGVSRPHW